MHTIRSLVQAVFRPLLAWVFIGGGLDVARNPASRVAIAGPTIDKIREFVPIVPPDNEMVVRANAVAQVAAGSLLAIGRLPRLAALTLAGSLIPTTYAGHAFWNIDDEKMRGMQRIHFNKNVAIIGGLLLVATAPPA